jgi:hypothetical protein
VAFCWTLPTRGTANLRQKQLVPECAPRTSYGLNTPLFPQLSVPVCHATFSGIGSALIVVYTRTQTIFTLAQNGA